MIIFRRCPRAGAHARRPTAREDLHPARPERRENEIFLLLSAAAVHSAVSVLFPAECKGRGVAESCAAPGDALVCRGGAGKGPARVPQSGYGARVVDEPQRSLALRYPAARGADSGPGTPRFGTGADGLGGGDPRSLAGRIGPLRGSASGLTGAASLVPPHFYRSRRLAQGAGPPSF